VRVERHRRAERLQDVDLARRVVDVVVAADDVRDAHVPVIDDDAEIVGRRAVGARDDQVVEFAVGDLDAPLDEVIPGDHAVVGLLKRTTGCTPAGGVGSVLPGSGRQRPS
jgi:hypothetical protein